MGFLVCGSPSADIPLDQRILALIPRLAFPLSEKAQRPIRQRYGATITAFRGPYGSVIGLDGLLDKHAVTVEVPPFQRARTSPLRRPPVAIVTNRLAW